MNAVTLNDEGIAVIDESQCIGCGVCTGVCEFEAMELALRGEVTPPPTLEEMLAARFKSGS